jgi:uncharacterized protein (UPF0333 family)
MTEVLGNWNKNGLIQTLYIPAEDPDNITAEVESDDNGLSGL